MRFSKTELLILEQIVKENIKGINIASALGRNRIQIYKEGRKLVKKQILTSKKGIYEPTKMIHTNLILNLLIESPSLIEPLSDSGIEFFYLLIKPKSISELILESKLKKSQIFKKIKQARAISLVRKIDGKYGLNEKIRGKVITFLIELKKYEETIDSKIPSTSLIYYKKDDELLFSNQENLDATLTAFSAYYNYGIKLMTKTNYYFLPNKKLTKKEVFIHSLYITEKDKEIRHIIFIALFYAKHMNELQDVKHEIIDNVKEIFKGKHIPLYPSLSEIKDRADVYDIKI